jgi:hypothetical protein
MESLAAVVAYHVVSSLGISFSFRKTNITGIKGCTDNTVTAFQYEEFDSFALDLVRKIVGFSIVNFLSRDMYKTIYSLYCRMFFRPWAKAGVAVGGKQ